MFFEWHADIATAMKWPKYAPNRFLEYILEYAQPKPTKIVLIGWINEHIVDTNFSVNRLFWLKALNLKRVLKLLSILIYSYQVVQHFILFVIFIYIHLREWTKKNKVIKEIIIFWKKNRVERATSSCDTKMQ